MLVNYAVNQEEYIEQFCENKENPESNCLGSCHLTEQLQFNQVDLSNQLEESFTIVLSIFSFQQLNEIRPTVIIQKEELVSCFLTSFAKDHYLSSVFKPPIFFRLTV